MDIDQPAAVTVDEVFGEHAHETGKHDDIRTVCVDGLGQRGVEIGALLVLAVIDNGGGDAVVGSRDKPLGGRIIADHRADLRRQFGSDQRRHIAAASGNQYRNAFQDAVSLSGQIRRTF